jgi:hypothetical protein
VRHSRCEQLNLRIPLAHSHFAPLWIAAGTGHLWNGLSLFSFQFSRQCSVHSSFSFPCPDCAVRASAQHRKLCFRCSNPPEFLIPTHFYQGREVDSSSTGLWLSFMSFLVVRSERSQQVRLAALHTFRHAFFLTREACDRSPRSPSAA